uniref:Uncharacterized protein n=1 Tax=Echinococcus canadensis TaxID=519352 RepID=A0A915EU40_9CEST
MSKQLDLFYITLFLLFGLSGLCFRRALPHYQSKSCPLLRASFSDPGILPRATPMEVQCMEG